MYHQIKLSSTEVSPSLITGNNLGDNDAEMFFKLLESNSVLRRLYLRNNHFEREAAKWFRDALATNESLRILDLSWNHLRLMGAIWICEGVQVPQKKRKFVAYFQAGVLSTRKIEVEK